MPRPLDGPALVADYLRGKEPATAFYPDSPHLTASFIARAADVDRRFGPAERAALREFVHPATAESDERLRRVVGGDALLVTTGHQPTLFTGPLYTIHKLLSTIRLADDLTRHLDRAVEPLFWIASDDHDWAEANHAHVLDVRNTLVRIAIERDASLPPISLARVRPGPTMHGALDELEAALPRTEFTPELLDLVRDSYQPERSATHAFREMVSALCGRFGFLVVDAAAPGLKSRAARLLEAELEAAGEHETLLRRTTERLKSAGYEAQVPILEGASNVFYEDDEGRDRLFRESSGGWTLRRSGRRLASSEVRTLLRSAPERFSANVLLRPVVESVLLPTLGYVGGPGELAYLAQAGPLFRAHGLEPPLAVPRRGAVLVEAKVSKVLEKFGLEPADLERPVDEIAARVARDELPEAVTDALFRLRAQLGEGYEQLAAAAGEVDPTLAGPLRGALKESNSLVDAAEKRILKHWKQRNAIALGQLEKAATNLFPDGRPQERVLNVCSYLARYGPRLLDVLADSFSPTLRSPEPAGVRDSAGH